MSKFSIAAGVLAASLAIAPAGAVEIIYSLGFDPGVGRDDGVPIAVDRFNNVSGAPLNGNSLSGSCYPDFPTLSNLGDFPVGQFAGFANDSVANTRLNPNGTQCYMVVSPSGGSAVLPNNIGSGAGTDFSTASTGERIGYVGFHWGSVDSWNTLIAIDANGDPVALPGDTNADGVLDGTEAAAGAGIAVDTATGTYVNVLFAEADDVVLIGWGNVYNNAFELTALANVNGYFSFTPFGFGIEPEAVPAPMAALLLPLGIAGLMLQRRRR